MNITHEGTALGIMTELLLVVEATSVDFDGVWALENSAVPAASACPSSRLSMASVALLREPFGLPAFPLENWPAVFLPFFIFPKLARNTARNSNLLPIWCHACCSKHIQLPSTSALGVCIDGRIRMPTDCS